MGRNYTRKTMRQSWPEDSMEIAVSEVMGGTMGYTKAAKTYCVPQSTLEARVKKARISGSLTNAGKKGMGKLPVFTSAQEKELVDHIVEMENRLFGITMNELRALAFELADKNNITNNFNKDSKMAGKDWLYAFLQRHPDIKLRKPEATSLGRAIGFNQASVKMFFDLLTSLYDKYNFTAGRVFNVDETGITTVPTKQSKVLALRGKRQVGALVSAERGTLVTAVICMNAAGTYMPSMFIFPRVRAKPELLDDAPPESTAEFHPSGWMQKDLFIKWFQRFIAFTKPSESDPVLLLLDGHATHTKSLELIEMARKNHVVLLCFPPHCTHRLQPLDVSFMSPLMQYYSEEARKWVRLHPGRPITINQIGKLYGAAFMKAASMETAVNGFRRTGIFPLDASIFPDWMFQPAATTDRANSRPSEQSGNDDTVGDIPLNAATTDRANSRPSEPSGNDSVGDIPVTAATTDRAYTRLSESHGNVSVGNIPGTSGLVSSPTESRLGLSDKNNRNASSNSSFTIPPTTLMPIPHAKRNPAEGRGRRRGKAAVLTDSPYKKELIIIQSAAPKSLKRKNAGVPKPQNSSKKHKNKEDSNKSIPTVTLCVSDDDDVPCMYCAEQFSTSKSAESWVQCLKCHSWSHEGCAGVDTDDCRPFECDFCQFGI